MTNVHVAEGETVAQEVSPRHVLSSSTRLKHKEIVGAHPGRGKRPVWELVLQSIQLGGSLVFPRKIVGSEGHGDYSLGLFFRDLDFYPELPGRGVESMGVKYKVVSSFTCDWGAIAKRPLRKC